MNKWRRLAIASLVLAGTGMASAHEYRSPGLQFVTSTKPIPPEHAVCLKFMDEHLRWLRDNRKRVMLPVFQKIYDQALSLETDWLVPTRQELDDTDKMRRLDYFRSELTKKRAEYERGKKDNSFALLKGGLPALNDNVVLTELSLNNQEADEKYSNCVRASKLLK